MPDTRPSLGARLALGVLASTLAALALLPAGASAAKHCRAPGDGGWQRATPAEAGMDAAKLQSAIDYATTQQGLAVRVYRYGCLVGEDDAASVNNSMRFESWSMAKSVSSLLFGRAMTQGKISPSDRVGALVPEADAEHGSVTMEDILTQSSGVHWNGFRDYNISQRDRVGDWLTLPFDHKPGTWFEYAQSAVAMIPKAVGVAVGKDPQAYLQHQLLDRIGIKPNAWKWERDNKGNVEGFWGARMRINDFARLGELMRRDGRWNGKRLLSKEYVQRALAPSKPNPCYGWLIWTNNGKPCIGPRITDRDVVDEYGYPGTPRDMFVYSGLFGQIVAVFPSQGIVIARTGQDSPTTLAGATSWQLELFKRVLRSITDEPVDLPDDGNGETIEAVDGGFQDAFFHPGEYSQGVIPDPLPPAGPPRVRAPRLRAGGHGIKGRRAFVLVDCQPAPEGAVQICRGKLRAKGARPSTYRIAAGKSKRIGLLLGRGTVGKLIRKGRLTLHASARNRDSLGGSATAADLHFRDAAAGPRKGF
jgi:CubicO group peptidase (beta-lactamase class C family)